MERRAFFVPSDAFLGDEVGIGPRVAGGPVFVMNIHHQLVLGRFSHGMVQPCRGILVSHIHKTILQSLDSPFLVERQDFVELVLQRPHIHIQDDAHPFTGGIVDYFLQVQFAFRPGRVYRYGRRVGPGVVLGSVPAGVEFHIFNAVGGGKVHAGHAPLCGERHLADHIAWFDPVCPFQLVGLVQVQDKVVVLHYLSRMFSYHHIPPGGVVVGQVQFYLSRQV